MAENEKLYWEDFHPGETLTYDGKTVTREEIAEYNRVFGQHPLRENGDELIANEVQAACFFMRLLVDNVLSRSSSMGSPGLKSLRWYHPVRPGDTLHARQETLNRTVHPRRPHLGFTDSRFELRNQRDEVVLEMESSGLFLLRNPREESGT